MRHSLSLTSSRWYRQLPLWAEQWVRLAICALRQDLPWISDSKPSEPELVEMQAICAQCPVLTRCAGYALTGGDYGRSVDGGFYAGIWLPWPYSGESSDIRLTRMRGRARLRQIVEARSEPGS